MSCEIFEQWNHAAIFAHGVPIDGYLAHLALGMALIVGLVAILKFVVSQEAEALMRAALSFISRYKLPTVCIATILVGLMVLVLLLTSIPNAPPALNMMAILPIVLGIGGLILLRPRTSRTPLRPRCILERQHCSRNAMTDSSSSVIPSEFEFLLAEYDFHIEAYA